MRMNAAPHLLHRMRRWWHLKLLQTRVDQMACLAAQMEADIERDITELAALNRTLRHERARLAAARHLGTPSRQPFTWGM
jgi:hypothetical protein